MAQNLLEQPVKKVLITMAAPAAFGMLLTFLFQLVDTYFVGKLGTDELTAISFSFPIYILIVSLFMGMATGLSSAVGKALGEQNPTKAQALTTLSTALFILLTVLLGFIGFYTILPVFTLLGASEEIAVLTGEYMEIVYLGMFALVGTLTLNAALMAKGMMIKSSVIMAIGGIINVVLDYILIFGIGPFPVLELKGAALASIISWHSTLFIMMYVAYKEGLFSFRVGKHLKASISLLKEVLTVGVPAIAAQILNPIAIVVITRLVAQSGDEAVAAYGIAARIESLGSTGILALSIILTPVVAQNYGADLRQRLDQVVAYSGRMAVYWGIALYLLMLLFAGSIASVFTDNSEVVAHVQHYLWIVGLSFPVFGLLLMTTSFFNGVYQPKLSLRITLTKALGMSIPFAIAGFYLFDLTGLWLGIAAANILGSAYAGKLLFAWQKQSPYQ